MADVTQQGIDDFHRFVTGKLQTSSAGMSWDELFIEWHSLRERDVENAAIREGLADVDAGRYQGAAEAMEDIRKKFTTR